jgi:hypothetical protein
MSVQYNTCEGCGASNGRAGLLISNPDIAGGKYLCINCHDTAKTGDCTVHLNLPRTAEELEKSLALADGRRS